MAEECTYNELYRMIRHGDFNGAAIAVGLPPPAHRMEVRQVADGAIEIRIEAQGFGMRQHFYLDGELIVEEYEQRRQERREARAEANAKARATLSGFLTAAQRQTYEEFQFFDVPGSEGNDYRITTGGSASGNVHWIDRPASDHMRFRGTYCAYPSARDGKGTPLPQADLFLGQFLQLVTEEFVYLATSNCFQGGYPKNYLKWRAKQEHPWRPDCECATCNAYGRRW